MGPKTILILDGHRPCPKTITITKRPSNTLTWAGRKLHQTLAHTWPNKLWISISYAQNESSFSYSALLWAPSSLPISHLAALAWRKSAHKSWKCLASLHEESTLAIVLPNFTFGAVGQISDAAYKIIKQPEGWEDVDGKVENVARNTQLVLVYDIFNFPSSLKLNN